MALGAKRIVMVVPPERIEAVKVKVAQTLAKLIPDFEHHHQVTDAMPNGFTFEADMTGSGPEAVKVAILPAVYGKSEAEGGIPGKYLRMAKPGVVLGLGPLGPGRTSADLHADHAVLDALAIGGVVLADQGVHSATKRGNDPLTGRMREQRRGPLQSYAYPTLFGFNTQGSASKDDVTYAEKPLPWQALQGKYEARALAWQEGVPKPKDGEIFTLPNGLTARFMVRYDDAQGGAREEVFQPFPEAADTKEDADLRIIHSPTLEWNADGKYRMRPLLGGRTTLIRTSMRVKGFGDLVAAINDGKAGRVEEIYDPHMLTIYGNPRSGEQGHPLSLPHQLQLIATYMERVGPDSASPSKPRPVPQSEKSVAPSPVPQELSKPASLADLASKFGGPTKKKK